MPIYEYECENCGCVQEVIQNFSDSPLTDCQHCAGKLHKLISQSSFHLKGTGWYVTDYANKSGKKTESSSSPQDKKSDDSKSKAETPSQSSEKSAAE